MNPMAKAKDKKNRIFIVDDHPILRQGLMQLINLEEDMITVGEAGNAADAMKGIIKEKPDLAIVDISLEGTSGLELTKMIVESQPNLPVLIVSMYDESVYVDRALQAGAKGYLMKREMTGLIMLAIRKVLDGDIYVSDRWKEKLLHKFAASKTGVTSIVELSAQDLSNRQLEVLQLTGQGHSTRQIADELHVSVKTVESHYANIKLKLNLKNSHELIQYAVTWFLTQK